MDVTTEFGEIRLSVFTSTKSHEAFEPSFLALRDSLQRYGHPQPELVFTDNVSDATMLQRIYPSLLEGVQPVDAWAHLDPLSLPPTPQICVTLVQGLENIENIIRGYLFQPDGSEQLDSFKMVVGMDMEWNVQISNCGPAVSAKSGKTAILTIAQDTTVHVLQIAPFVFPGKFPPLLSTFLSHSGVTKVGRGIKNDLKRLTNEVKPLHDFKGGEDLIDMAYDRGLVPSRNKSLADLCGRILHRRLDKNPEVRTSTVWEDHNLPPKYIEYAALDAWASWKIYQELLTLPIPGILPKNSPMGTAVSLWTEDHLQIAAHGFLSDRQLKEASGISLSKATQTIITVTEVYVPGALLSTHKKASLESFGPPPFQIVCQWRHLQSRDSAKHDSVSNNPHDQADPGLRILTAEEERDYRIMEKNHGALNQLGDTTKADSHNDSNDLNEIYSDPPVLDTYSKDPESEQTGTQLLSAITPPDATRIYSRVLKDLWHLMHMIVPPANHGLRHAFSTAFRDILLVPDDDDKKRISNYAVEKGTTFEKLVRSKPQWVWAHCKRLVRPPSVLYPLVEELFKTYGPLKDAATGQPLFNKNVWKAAQGVLKTIRDGFVSDPPGVALYYQIGVDSKANNLPIYHCCRGTNLSEGAVHRPILHVFPSNGVGVRHAIMSLVAFVLKHNLKVLLILN